MKRSFAVYNESGKLLRTLSTHGDPSSSLEFGEYFEEVDSLDGITFPPTEIDENLQSITDLRLLRNQLLSSSDWTQVADAPVDQAAWAVYRQQLRDLPDSTEDPRNPVWPTPPA